jgi:hypothetical protein
VIVSDVVADQQDAIDYIRDLRVRLPARLARRHQPVVRESRARAARATRVARQAAGDCGSLHCSTCGCWYSQRRMLR